GVGLLGKSLYRLLHVDLGMNPDHLASVVLQWPRARYSSDEEKTALARQIVERIRSIAGVGSVAVSLAPPLSAAWGSTSFHVAGEPNHGEINEVLNRQVSSAYFTTLKARLVRGRYFQEIDNASKPRVAIVNLTLAKRYFGSDNP